MAATICRLLTFNDSDGKSLNGLGNGKIRLFCSASFPCCDKDVHTRFMSCNDIGFASLLTKGIITSLDSHHSKTLNLPSNPKTVPKPIPSNLVPVPRQSSFVTLVQRPAYLCSLRVSCSAWEKPSLHVFWMQFGGSKFP